jgi:hypothetical protein
MQKMHQMVGLGCLRQQRQKRQGGGNQERCHNGRIPAPEEG